MGCMKPISADAIVCPHCAYNSLSPQLSPYLEKGTVLLGKYTVGKVLTSTPDQCIYIGYDIEQNRTIKIVEFLPKKLIERENSEKEIRVKEEYEHLYFECLGSFESMWKNLQNIKGSVAIDSVYDFFFLNATAYAVLQYNASISLKAYFDSRNKLLSWNKAVAAFKPVMSVLERMHKLGMVHAALSPDTLSVGTDGKIKISVFPVIQSCGKIPEISQPIFPGYAPIERYKADTPLSSVTDVYSVAALIYTAATGLVPPPANARIASDSLTIPASLKGTMGQTAINAFYSAMEVFPSDRLSSLEQLKVLFTVPESEQKSTKQPTTQAEKITKSQPKVDSSKPPKGSKQQKEEKKESVLSATLKVFFTVIVVCAIVFLTLYTTFLYKHIEFDFLNDALSSVSFLPMNMDSQLSTEPSTTEDIFQTQPAVTSVTVADFTVLNYEEVKQNSVFNSNFNLVYTFEYSDTYKKNTIISQSIPHGQIVQSGTTINLVVSKGKEKIVLSDVIGMNYDDAYAVLTSDGFTVKKIILKNDGAQTPDEVFTMSHVAGIEFEKGTEITLSVWGNVHTQPSEEQTTTDQNEQN